LLGLRTKEEERFSLIYLGIFFKKCGSSKFKSKQWNKVLFAAGN